MICELPADLFACEFRVTGKSVLGNVMVYGFLEPAVICISKMIPERSSASAHLALSSICGGSVMRSNIVISRIFSAYFWRLPLISAANAEEAWAFFGDSGGQNRHFPKTRKAIFSATAAAAQVARSCPRCAASESLFSPNRRGVCGLDSRYILYHNKKHPRDMGALEVELYLTHLAVGEKVSTNTQKQALNALVFLYHRVLQKPLGRFRDIERPKRPQRRPLVLAKDEVERI